MTPKAVREAIEAMEAIMADGSILCAHASEADSFKRLSAARAALQRMEGEGVWVPREPSEAAIEGLLAMLPQWDEVYRAMINAALTASETGGED